MLIQGTTLSLIAKWLNVALPEKVKPISEIDKLVLDKSFSINFFAHHYLAQQSSEIFKDQSKYLREFKAHCSKWAKGKNRTGFM